MKQLFGNNKPSQNRTLSKIKLLDKHDAKTGNFICWAKTNNTNKLLTKMNQVRSKIENKPACKLKMVQTNHTAWVGSGNGRCKPVLNWDNNVVKPNNIIDCVRFLATTIQSGSNAKIKSVANT